MGGGPDPKEHATVGLARWVGFLVFAALLIGGTTAVLVWLWRWIF